MGVVALAENRLGSMTLQGIAIPTALAVVLGPESRYQALRIRRTAARPPINSRQPWGMKRCLRDG
jgi:hypothetical protein